MSSAAVPEEQEEQKARPLQSKEIEYLVLEGGGGKGFAYLGALQVLDDLKVFEQVVGYAGASAGAITALCLALGLTPSEIQDFMEKPAKLLSYPGRLGTPPIKSFTDFFDVPIPEYNRLRPTVTWDGVAAAGGFEKVPTTDDERQWRDSKLEVSLSLGALGLWLLGGPLGKVTTSAGLFSLIKNRDNLRSVFDKASRTPPFDSVIKHWNHYLAYLPKDKGLFSGHRARETFDQLIGLRFRNQSGIAKRHVTFKEFCTTRGKLLAVTGSNLSTGKTELFSFETTPDFPVADAIRISMGIPFVFKPVEIRNDIFKGRPPCGLYVDGGLWNNLPFREFDGMLASAQVRGKNASSARVPASAECKPKTLALRLGLEPVTTIENIGDLLKRIGNFGLFGSGETQVLTKYVDQAILLDTEGLDLLNFSPDPIVKDKVIKRARRLTRQYFGLENPPKDKDELDDMEVELRRRKQYACQS